MDCFVAGCIPTNPTLKMDVSQHPSHLTRWLTKTIEKEKQCSIAIAKTKNSIHSSSEEVHVPESASSPDLMALPSPPFFFFLGGGRDLCVFGFAFAPLSGSDWFDFFPAGVAGGSSPFFPAWDPSFFFFSSFCSSPVMAVTNAEL